MDVAAKGNTNASDVNIFNVPIVIAVLTVITMVRKKTGEVPEIRHAQIQVGRLIKNAFEVITVSNETYEVVLNLTRQIGTARRWGDNDYEIFTWNPEDGTIEL